MLVLKRFVSQVFSMIFCSVLVSGNDQQPECWVGMLSAEKAQGTNYSQKQLVKPTKTRWHEPIFMSG